MASSSATAEAHNTRIGDNAANKNIGSWKDIPFRNVRAKSRTGAATLELENISSRKDIPFRNVGAKSGTGAKTSELQNIGSRNGTGAATTEV